MQVRLLTIYAGPLGNAHAGQVLDLPEVNALTLIEAGHARPVGAAPAARRETATSKPDELRIPDFLNRNR